MKQSIPIASRVLALVSVILGLFCTACVTLPRQTLGANEPTAAVASSRSNINTATAAELGGLPGIGKAIAERIVAHRQKHGAFRRPEHLMMVRGISEQKFLALRSRITVE